MAVPPPGRDRGGADFTHMALEESTRNVPPGWRPYVPSYPWKRYKERLQLWWRFAEVREDQVGALVAARLQGQAFELAMNFKIIRQGVTHVGVEALSLPASENVTDALGNILEAAQPTGIAQLLSLLAREYEIHDQDKQTHIIDKFLDTRRGNMPLQEFLLNFRERCTEASDKAGLTISNPPPPACEVCRLATSP